MSDAVAIIGGTGALGFGLAGRLCRDGVRVRIGEPDATRAAELADRLPGATGHDLAGAVRDVAIVALTVPFRLQSETLNNLRHVLRPGQVLLDCTVPLAAAVSGRATRTVGVWQGSAAQQAAEMVPEGVRVVSALHTVSAARLRDAAVALDEDVLVCGDDEDAKASVVALLQQIDGLRCVDCGPLEQARLTEQLRPLLIGIDERHRSRAGLKITGLAA